MMQGATENERLERGSLFESEEAILIFSDSHWAIFYFGLGFSFLEGWDFFRWLRLILALNTGVGGAGAGYAGSVDENRHFGGGGGTASGKRW